MSDEKKQPVNPRKSPEHQLCIQHDSVWMSRDDRCQQCREYDERAATTRIEEP